MLSACGGGGGSADPAPALEPVTTWQLPRRDASVSGVDPNAVDALFNHMFSDQASQVALLVRHGYVIGERYAEGYDEQDFTTSWSVAKSFYSSAIGIAIDEGWIESVNQPASDFIAEWRGTEKAAISIGQMLQMRAGLGDDGGLFISPDHTNHALNTPLVSSPGARFLYSNPNSQLFGLIIERATGLDAHDYLRGKLLRPIGIDTDYVGLWLDPSGENPLTYCCIDMRAEAFARFGILYVSGGSWEGRRVVSEHYVKESLSATEGFYGYQWWKLNQAYFGAANPPPIELWAAQGLDGQHIYLWREEEIVLVGMSKYQHFRNAGYVLSTSNFPNTCSGRNSCPGSLGLRIPQFNERRLVDLVADLRS